ncbi:tyrosine-type recombinase/integrase [Pseudonocardia sp. WMMC193]|uniref:tyrosine-type recombinase/integrase n=1 Tax=Pseudonocardia sp. WMMC193 TaxID=2911965 RepID=UPI001F02F9AB|nr:tyrosine-type recombinase/integrase [Pseudonocardia sp. WMMC193]MCF7552557.1 tyrosine-type recombinase/integrase [Pseudonocardia sp. WMMC193]
MAGPVRAGKKRPKGNIEPLPSGALRVSVYAGIDPVSGRRHYLKETVPAGPKAAVEAEATRARLVAEVAERRNPRTGATIDQLLEKYLDQLDGSPNTLTLYRGYVKNHLSPLLGSTKVRALDPELLDSFYSELRRCRVHCDRARGLVDHRTQKSHECDERCREHKCRPLARSTVRHIHFILSGAYRKAVRWRWVTFSPISQGEPPAASSENPDPPNPKDAARIVTAAYRDSDWGTFVWTKMTTGARRGEMCAMRWSTVSVESGRESIWLKYGIRKDGKGGWEEAELKTHQQRRIALDSETAAALIEHRARCEERARTLGMRLRPDGFVFSTEPDGSTFPIPDSVGQRYDRLVRRLNIHTTIHKLRHYSATELILAGVDIRTVAGRLGHGGGGTTTLRTYTAWVSEADQRAAAGWSSRMPARSELADARAWMRNDPQHPYERVAAELARQVEGGELAAGDPAPEAETLAAGHGVSVATARRAVALAREWGLIFTDGTGRPRIAQLASSKTAEAVPDKRRVQADKPLPYWSVQVSGPGGIQFPARTVRGDIEDPDTFRSHLVGIVRAERPDLADEPENAWIEDYELHLRRPGSQESIAIFRLS